MPMTLVQENTKGGSLKVHLIHIDCTGSVFSPSYVVALEACRENNLKQTSFLSLRFVSITIVAVFCSQIICQKSATVSGLGPEKES